MALGIPNATFHMPQDIFGSMQTVETETLSETDQRRAKAALELLGLTQKEAAEEYDLSERNFHRIVNGRLPCWPSYRTAIDDLIDRAREIDL